MEDRYVIIPSLLIKSLGVNLISSVSDWGEDYSKSLDLGEGIMRKMFLKYSEFYEIFVKKLSRSVIVRSENVRDIIMKECDRPIAIFPHCVDFKSLKSQPDCNLDFTDNIHDIYCVLVGNFSYLANLEMAQFIINNVSGKVMEKDRRIKFVIVGKDSDLQFGHINIENIAVLGIVQDLECVYNKCQIGLNATNVPGGTSAKNIEYLVNGLYVVGTPESSIGVIESKNIIISNRQDFIQTILNVADLIRSKGTKNLESEVEKIREYYSLERNAEKIVEFILHTSNENYKNGL